MGSDVWTPAVNEAKMSDLYQVYPNPASSSVYVAGLDIKKIEILL